MDNTHLCASCFTTPAFVLPFAGMSVCIACADEWQELEDAAAAPARLVISTGAHPKKITVSSCFAYRGIVRGTIIAAKVKGDHTALARILAVWGRSLPAALARQRFDFVMPCPSSLWSRMHGRLDIAWLLAEQVANQLKTPLRRPPRRLYWRLRKQARAQRPVDNLLITADDLVGAPEFGEAFSKRALIVDDVVTTGATIRQCVEAVNATEEVHFSALTFARSRFVTR